MYISYVFVHVWPIVCIYIYIYIHCVWTSAALLSSNGPLQLQQKHRSTRNLEKSTIWDPNGHRGGQAPQSYAEHMRNICGNDGLGPILAS